MGLPFQVCRGAGYFISPRKVSRMVLSRTRGWQDGRHVAERACLFTVLNIPPGMPSGQAQLLTRRKLSLTPTLHRFSYLPRIVVFIVPQVICLTILCLHSKIEVVRLPPGLQDCANRDLVIIHQKREGPFISLVTSQLIPMRFQMSNIEKLVHCRPSQISSATNG